MLYDRLLRPLVIPYDENTRSFHLFPTLFAHHFFFLGSKNFRQCYKRPFIVDSMYISSRKCRKAFALSLTKGCSRAPLIDGASVPGMFSLRKKSQGLFPQLCWLRSDNEMFGCRHALRFLSCQCVWQFPVMQVLAVPSCKAGASHKISLV